MNTLTAHDLQVLADYHFIKNDSNKYNDKLIGVKWVKKDGNWNQELVEVNRQDVTCWSLFLSLFGIGKLKHTSVYLDKACSYLLSQYNWKEIKLKVQDKDETSDEYQAFKTVCHLANRQMQRWRPWKSYPTLFKEISEPIDSEFNHYWNLVIDGRTLCGLQRYRLPNAEDIKLRFIDSQTFIDPYRVLTKDDVANIEVGFKYEHVYHFDQSYYSAESPYYSTAPLPCRAPRRNEL